jgi:hypothetical protein
VHPKVIDLSGKVFGRLTVLHLTNRSSGGKMLWRCNCACGKTKTLAQWCLEYNINYGTALSRLVEGWSDEYAITKPINISKRNKTVK